MTCLVVLEQEKDLTKKVKISAKAGGTGGSRLGIKKDDEITVKDLLYGLMLCSRKRHSSCTCRARRRKHSRIFRPNEPKSRRAWLRKHTLCNTTWTRRK